MQRSIRIGLLATRCAAQGQMAGSARAGPSTFGLRQQEFHTIPGLRAAQSSSSSSKQVAQADIKAQSTESVSTGIPASTEKTTEGKADEGSPVTTPEATVPTSNREPQTSSEFAAQDKKPLPFLSAPLGVPNRPSSKKLSWIEKRDRQFDDSLRMQRRKAIIKEATRGYFHDVHAMRSHGGKTWLAPSTLIRHDRALYFPAIEGQSLSEKQKVNTADLLPAKVSIVCILTSQVSEEHAKSFYEAAYQVYKNDANFQLVRINLQENLFKAALVTLFTSSLRKTIPVELQKTYLLSSQDLTTERDMIALHNKHVGYTYLVGPDGKIRWAGCGFAERSEAQALVACTGVLLSRLAEGGKKM